MRLALAVAVLFLGTPSQDDVVKKIVPDAEKVKKLVKKVPPAGRDRIEKALGEKLADADLAPALWECYSTVPRVSSMEKTRCVVTSVTVRTARGIVRVGVAVAPVEKTVHVVKVLENADDKALESRLFLAQFDGFEYSEALYGTPASFAEGLKKAQGSDDASKETNAILRMNSIMRAMGPSWDRMMQRIDKRDKTAAAEAEWMDKAFDDTLKLLPAAKFFKATKQDKFKAFASGSRSDLGELKKLLDAGKFEDAFRKAGSLDGDRCAKCHASYRNEFRTEREKRGLGNGYFFNRLTVGPSHPQV